MKCDRCSIVTAFFLILTAMVLGWGILVAVFGVDLLAMFHVAAPSSAERDRMVAEVCADSRKLLSLAVIPLVLTTLLWMSAFLIARRRRARETDSRLDKPLH